MSHILFQTTTKIELLETSFNAWYDNLDCRDHRSSIIFWRYDCVPTCSTGKVYLECKSAKRHKCKCVSYTRYSPSSLTPWTCIIFWALWLCFQLIIRVLLWAQAVNPYHSFLQSLTFFLSCFLDFDFNTYINNFGKLSFFSNVGLLIYVFGTELWSQKYLDTIGYLNHT